ncbi:uncharacterized protein LOC121369900 [Gigantopelta aegis]|uniref:uncharacterized protein LOC121369900 n=1 Tax=Gigantopelta aegis TaxID=1735272 RepID=UPI001B88848D|nr:uncharacterized protein LOC121369900 [Gigantopelta aegis]
MNGWIFFAIATVTVWRCSSRVLPGKLNNVYACYGASGATSFLSPTCADDERMVVENIYALTKPVDKNCPSAMTTGVDRADCCIYEDGDCVEQYDGEVRISYFESFTGTQQFSKSSVNQRTSELCLSGNVSMMDFSNYMLMTFYCINETLTASFNDNEPVTAPVVYWRNTEYPDVISNLTSSITCSASTSCDSSILITAIDLSLHNDSTGCVQSLDVVDGNTVKTFTCTDNNQYDIKTIFISSSHFIKVTFRTGGQANGGKLWIQFNATESEAVLTLACGASALTTASLVDSCDTTGTSKTTTTTTASLDNTSKSSDEDAAIPCNF